jgi:hypothetical protein
LKRLKPRKKLIISFEKEFYQVIEVILASKPKAQEANKTKG